MIARPIIAWFGNLIDTISTVYLYTNGLGVEINPISAWLLNSPPVFVVVKLTLMTAAVWFIWRNRDRTLFRVAGWILAIEYLLVALYYAVVFAIVI